MNDDGLRELYAELMEVSASQEGTPCPSLEQLAETVEGTLSEPERLAIVDHVMACRTCQSEFELLRSLDAARPRSKWRWRQLALAASVVLVAGSAAFWTALSRGRLEGPIFRSGSTSLSLVSPRAGERVTLPTSLSWQALPGAFGYQVELLDSAGALAFSGPTPDTVLILPADAPISAGEYRWYVTAILEDGTEVRSSPRPLVINLR